VANFLVGAAAVVLTFGAGHAILVFMKARRDIWRLDVVSWALYDFANTIYSMNILSLYFAGWLVVDLGYQDISYSLAFSLSMLASAVLMPALGYLSDRPAAPRSAKRLSYGRINQRRLTFLFVFTAGAVGSVAIFAVLPLSMMPLILLLFALSNFFYEGGIVFYNALLDTVSNKENVGKVSGFGVSLGYLGSIAGMVLVLPFVTGGIFGLDVPFIAGSGKSGAFLPTAVFYALFAVPIFLFVREKIEKGIPDSVQSGQVVADSKPSLKNAYRDVWRSLKATEKYPGLLRFLISDYFFEDAIATVILFMAIYIEKVLGMGDQARTLFLIISTVFAMIGAYILGHLADLLSPKKVLFGIVLGWILVLLGFALNNSEAAVWVFGPVVGIMLGGVWAVSRPLLMQLSPPEKLGEFFGLFSLSGRAAAIAGPLVWGAAVYLFDKQHVIGRSLVDLWNLSDTAADKLPYRVAVLSLAIMMSVGLFIFRKVPDRKDMV
jgi:UMF1 family MFS transporter